MLTKLKVRVNFAEMLRVLPDDLLQAEVAKRASEPGARVAPTKGDGSMLQGYAKDSDMLAVLDDETLDEAVADRGLFGGTSDATIHDAVKEIDTAVKAGDMMHYRILMNRLAPNAVIL